MTTNAVGAGTSAPRRSILRSASRRSTGDRVAARPRSTSGKRGLAPSAVPSAVDACVQSPALHADHSRLIASIQHLTVDCSRLAAGYGMCARRASDPDVADLAGSLSTLHRAVAHELAAFLAAAGAGVPRTKSTCSEHLRWEWLASTGRLMNGAPERPLLAECARIERGDEDHVLSLRDEASNFELPQLRQLVMLLHRARAASLRLEDRDRSSSTAFTFG